MIMNNEVEDYIKKQAKDKQEVIQKLRNIIKKALPGIKEEMHWGVICYDDLYYIAALKNQVNMGFSIIGLSPEEIKLFEGGGKTMRHLKVTSLTSLDEKEIVKRILLIKMKAKPVH